MLVHLIWRLRNLNSQFHLALLAAVLMVCGGTTTARAATLTGLGDLSGGSFRSYAKGVSADGSVVVGLGFSPAGYEAFRWTSGGGMVGLGDFSGGSFYSSASGVSADGSVVVGNGSSTAGIEAFRWTSGGGMVGLSDLSGGSFSSSATGVSADGSVVVGQGISASGYEAFRWTSGGGMVGLGDLSGGSFYSSASGVSADGSVVVGRGTSAAGDEAFRWTSGGGMVGLGDLSGGSFYSYASGVSADGSVVVGRGNSAAGGEAFRWTSGGGMVGLGDLSGGSFSSDATGVSADGSVVVGYGSTALGRQSFIWTESAGMLSLESVLSDLGVDLTGWTSLTAAYAVSGNGRTIVGYGKHSGNDEAFVVDLNNLDMHWAKSGNGNWAEINKWSGSGGLFLPGGGTDNVSIDPTSGLTVSGPTDITAVGTLTLGATASGTATLDIQPTGNMTVHGLTSITSRGRLTGDGTFAALGGINNAGEIDLGKASLQITGGTLSNSGLVRGNGQIDSTLANTAAGEVRAESGRRMLLTGTSNTNAGEITLLGGTVEFREDLTNSSTGFIAGRGILIAKEGLANLGTMVFSGGTTDIFGDVDNQTGGRIVTSGGATTTFYDDVVHNGTEIRTSAGSATVMLGTVSGSGSYTGTGTVYFEGDLRPGNSPAEVFYGGDATLGSLNTLTMELAGTIVGTEYDKMNVAGILSLDGSLDVVLLDDFKPMAAHSFDLFDGTIVGTFSNVSLPTLKDGLSWNTDSLYTTGTISVVPEPSAFVLTLFGLLGLVSGCRRPRHVA